jgi:glycosyltransferase involved in cell wall biosynthesis
MARSLPADGWGATRCWQAAQPRFHAADAQRKSTDVPLSIGARPPSMTVVVLIADLPHACLGPELWLCRPRQPVLDVERVVISTGGRGRSASVHVPCSTVFCPTSEWIMPAGRYRKVIFFSPGQSEAGGCATHSKLISEGLAARGWHVIVICRAATSSRPRLARSANLTVVEVPGFDRRWGTLAYLAVSLPVGLVLGRRASFIAMQLGSQTLGGGLCARLLRRPFVVLSTTAGELSEVDEVLRSPGRLIHRQNLRRASYLVGQTTEAARELEAFVPPERIAVVPTPMPRGGEAELTGLPYATFSGRLSRGKNLDVLLDAWEKVVDRLPKARLTLVGSGGSYRSVENELRATVAARERLRETVGFTGWVDDVAPYLRAADVYVFPSRSEGMSNSLLEACAWRRIVVASDIVPNRAVLGDDYPLLFPTGDREALGEALIRAFEDTDARAAAAAAIDRRWSELSSDSAIARYEELLLGLQERS